MANKKIYNVIYSIFAVLVTVQIFIFIALYFESFHFSIVLTSYAILVLGISFIVKNYFLRIIAYIFAIIGYFSYNEIANQDLYIRFFTTGPLGGFKSQIYNDLNLATVLLTILFAGSAFLASKYNSRLGGSQKRLPDILESGAYIVIFTWLLSPLWVWPYNVIAIFIYSFILFYFGFIRSKKCLKIFGYICFVISALMFLCKFFY